MLRKCGKQKIAETLKEEPSNGEIIRTIFKKAKEEYAKHTMSS